jgi:hypothetical protein
MENMPAQHLNRCQRIGVSRPVCCPRKVREENINGDDVIITIYRLVSDYVVGRSTSWGDDKNNSDGITL